MATGKDVYDTVVIGAGIEGSSTAYHLAKCGKRVLLLDQFALPHTRGSSHGHSRVTEMSFGPNHFYIPLTIDANRMISDLQTESGEQLFIKCGWLCLGPRDDPFLHGTQSGLEKYAIPYEKFDGKEQHRRHPNMSFPRNFEFVLDKNGGILRADRMLHAFQKLFVRYGGILKEDETMTGISMGEIASVKTNKDVYKARAVVLTLGPWASQFLPRIGVHVPLETEEVIVSYWTDKTFRDFNSDSFPVLFSTASECGQGFGCIPAYEYPGLMKVVLPTGKAIDPDNRDESSINEAMIKLKKILSTHFPTLETDPHYGQSCIYTNTPDRNYILDVHPVWKNVVIGAGFSGHGFKLSPVVGKILAELAMGQQPSFDISRFKMNRFSQSKL